MAASIADRDPAAANVDPSSTEHPTASSGLVGLAVAVEQLPPPENTLFVEQPSLFD